MYIYTVSKKLKELFSIKSTLLYDLSSEIDKEMLRGFAAAFPVIDLKKQIIQIDPDVVFIHNVLEQKWINILSDLKIPAVRYVHDMNMFCLKGDRLINHYGQFCMEKVGPKCFFCSKSDFNNENQIGRKLTSIKKTKKMQLDINLSEKIFVSSLYMKWLLIQHDVEESKCIVSPVMGEVPKQANHYSLNNNIVCLCDDLESSDLDNILLGIGGTGQHFEINIFSKKNIDIEYGKLIKSELTLCDITFHQVFDLFNIVKYMNNSSLTIFAGMNSFDDSILGTIAMQSSTLVLAVDTQVRREWIKDQENGFIFTPGQTVEFEHLLERVLYSECDNKEYINNALKSININYSCSSHAIQVMDTFNSLVEIS
jgi:hypothetical protein